MGFFKTRAGKVSLGILVFLVTMGLGVLLGGQVNNILFESSVQSKESSGKAINILFMGIDARDAQANSRSDTMILASIDPETKKIAMVSIPRDTRIKNSAGNYDKINSVNYLDGPEAACKTVGALLNVPVDYYVVTNFGGFGDIVDALGGVHIDIESDMHHDDPEYPELSINLTKGYQYLNGDQALAFVRYRGGPTADIGRTENQQKFIKALAAEMLQSKTILKLPQLIPQLYKNVRTNLPLKDLIYLANMAQKLDMENINAQTLPGYFYHDNVTGASYWEADKNIASKLIAALLQGQTFKVVEEGPATSQPAPSNPGTGATIKAPAEEVDTQDKNPDTTSPDGTVVNPVPPTTDKTSNPISNSVPPSSSPTTGEVKP